MQPMVYLLVILSSLNVASFLHAPTKFRDSQRQSYTAENELNPREYLIFLCTKQCSLAISELCHFSDPMMLDENGDIAHVARSSG